MISTELSEAKKIWIARTFIILIVAVTYFVSLLRIESIFKMGVWSFAGFAALFPLVFAALYWRGLTAAGALAGILTSMSSWLYLFYDSGWASNVDYALELPVMGQVYALNPVVVPFFGGIVAMVLTSLVTRPPSQTTLQKFFNNQRVS
jgi:SSS family solute:Na+ symporter